MCIRDRLKANFSDVPNDIISAVVTSNKTRKEFITSQIMNKMCIRDSLHGMIVADSFHIPNMHITLTNNMFGDGNKYNDYLSAFDICLLVDNFFII